MSLSRRDMMAGSAGAAAFGALPYRSAKAQAAPTIAIGLLNDISGMYHGSAGIGALACLRVSVQEFAWRGLNIAGLAADPQTRADVCVKIARAWV